MQDSEERFWDRIRREDEERAKEPSLPEQEEYLLGFYKDALRVAGRDIEGGAYERALATLDLVRSKIGKIMERRGDRKFKGTILEHQ